MKNYLKKIIYFPNLQYLFTPSFYFLLLIILSIVIPYFIIFKKNFFLYSLLIITILILISLKKLFQQYHNYYKNNSFYLAILTISIVICISTIFNTYNLIKKKPLAKNTLFYGEIIKIKNDRYNNKLFIINKKINIKIIVFADKNIPCQKGDTLFIKKEIEEFNKTNEYSSKWIKQGIYYYVFLNKNDYKMSCKAKTNCFQNSKTILNNKISKIFPLETANFIKAILIGNRSLISKKKINTFKRAGIIHILALSGLHIGIIALIFFKFLYILRLKKKIIYIIISIVIFLYLEITLKPVSLIRAAIMIWIYTFIFINNLNKNLLNILFLSACIILILTPENLFTLGFQLSFSATLGIILFYKQFYKLLPVLPLKITESLSLSFSAQFFTIPIIAYTLDQINLNGIITNIIAVPLVSIILILSIITIITSFISIIISNYLAILCTNILNLLIIFCQYMSNLPAYFCINNFNIFLLIYLVIIFFLLQKRLFHKHKLILVVTITFTIIIMIISSEQSNNFIIKKSKELVVLKENKSLIIYGNAVSNKNFKIIDNQYINQNFENIYISLTSTKWETLNNFKRIIKKYPISKCYISSDFNYSNQLKHFVSLLEKEKIPLMVVDFKKIKQYKNEKLFYKCFFNY